MSGHLKWLPGISSSYNHIIKNQDKPAGIIFSWGRYEVCAHCAANVIYKANHPKEGLVVFHIFMSKQFIFGEQKPNELCYNQLSVIYFETIKYKCV